MPTSDEFYTASNRRLQDENDSRKLADAVARAIVGDELRPEQAGFIGSLDYFFLTTINERGEPTVSYKGGPVGLAHVMDPRTIVFPNYDGNGMFLSMGNVAATSKVGLLFIDMVTPLRVRVQGEAQLTRDAGHLTRFPGANMVVEVGITSVFYNCARYIHRHARVEMSRYVPDANGKQPFPAWKRIEDLQGSLRPDDEGRAEAEGGTITEEEYQAEVMRGTS
jgi:predicted pyridoxine 5'-phosphate oxidase superfamily flavin-nucleotide-binding protein